MRSNIIQKALQKGSLMVEALAMLGLIAMVSPMVYKKAAERTAEMQDINEAGYLRSLSRSFDDYLQDNFGTASLGPGMKEVDSATLDKIKKHLPEGYGLGATKYFDGVKLYIYTQEANSATNTPRLLSGFVVANPKSGSTLRSSRIASMVGTNGGYLAQGSSDVTGSQGVWSVAKSELSGIEDFAVVTSSIQSIVDTIGSDDFLHRKFTGNLELNMMETALDMDNYDVENVNKLLTTKGISVQKATGSSIASNYEPGEGGLSVEAMLKAGLSSAAGAAPEYLLNVGETEVAYKKIDTSGVTADVTDTIPSYVGIGGDLDTLMPNAPDGALIVGGTGIDTTTLTANRVETIEFAADTLEGGREIGSTGPDYVFRAEVQAGNDIDKRRVTIDNGTLDLVTSNLESKYFKVAADGTTIAGTQDPYSGVTSDIGVVTIGKNNEVFFDAEGNMRTESNIDAPYLYANDTGVQIANRDLSSTTASTLLNVDDSSIGLYQGGSYTLSDKRTFTPGADNRSIEIFGDHSGTGDPSGIELVDGDTTVAITDGSTPSGTTTQKKNFLIDVSGGEEFAVTDKNIDARAQLDVFDTNSPATSSTKILQVGGADNFGSSTPGTEIPNVYIRKGGIHIAKGNVLHDLPAGYKKITSSGTTTATGYINVDRMVSNTNYTEPLSSTSTSTSYTSDYDRYQVNPAYTSVMHDIKLSSRGGARLSDILPDYITKGIYTMQTDYADSNGSFNWSGIDINTGPISNAAKCQTASCEASPWMGLMPYPQCPPGYVLQATISPLRFAMAQTYVVSDPSSPVKSLSQNLDPFNGAATLEYLGFQGSTWLGMKLKEGGYNGMSGWHALMGFIYQGAEYDAFSQSISGTSLNHNEMYWNILPVLTQELSAIGTTYCHFNRSSFKDGIVDATYDQINNYREGYLGGKGNAEGRLNDPDLGYKDIW